MINQLSSLVLYRDSFTRFGYFLMDIQYIGRALFRNPMRLMQKIYLFSVQIGMPHANASKICRIYRIRTLPDYW